MLPHDGTVPGLLHAACARWADRPALRTRTGLTWVSLSWAEWLDTAENAAAALRDLGVAPGDRVALVSRARREAAEFAAGAALAGAVLVALPVRCDGASLDRLLDESAARVLVVDDPATLARCLALRRLPGVRRVIVIDPHATRAWRASRLDDVLLPAERSRAMLWPELLAAGRAVRDRGPAPALTRAPGDVFARLCTLRTAGVPRVVDLTHAQCVASAEALARALPIGPGDEQLMVASLASAFGLSQLLAAARAGMSTAFADPSRPPESQLSEVHPTLFAATPAYFERLREESLGRVRASRPLRRAAIDRALAVGQRVAALTRADEVPGRLLRAEHKLARRVALDALAGVFGARLRFAVTVGAALPVAVAEWFYAVGVLVLEGYGLTEAGGLTHLNTPGAWRFGTAGRGLPGVDSSVVDGELTLRGPMIRGTLRTGDRATLDRDGYLVVRGRICP